MDILKIKRAKNAKAFQVEKRKEILKQIIKRRAILIGSAFAKSEVVTRVSEEVAAYEAEFAETNSRIDAENDKIKTASKPA